MDYEKVYGDLFKNGYNLYGGNEISLTYVDKFVTNNNQIISVVDMGSGTGSVIKLLSSKHPQVKMTSCDLNNFHNLDCEFNQINLTNQDTYKTLDNRHFNLLTCLDVLEHLPKENIDEVMEFFSEISETCIFTIANHSDIQNGVELHTIIEDMSYWGPIISKYFDILELETYNFPQTNNSTNYLYVLLVTIKN